MIHRDLATVTGSDDAADAAWFPLGEPPALAFDHDEIVAAARDALASARVTAPRE